jgi:hypothetical protein
MKTYPILIVQSMLQAASFRDLLRMVQRSVEMEVIAALFQEQRRAVVAHQIRSSNLCLHQQLLPRLWPKKQCQAMYSKIQ